LLKVRGDKLEWTQVIRSNDLFRGLPHNLVQFTALQEVMAGWLGIEVGDFHLVTDSLHFYETDSSIFECGSPLEIVESQESLALPKDESEKAFRILGDTVERIIDPATSPRALLEELDIVELPQEFRNLLCVLLAEGLRRRRQRELVRDAMRSCHSSVYNHLWNRWQSRMERSRRPIEDGEVEFLASEGDRYAK
jgi:thymidylate synthase